VNQEGMLKPALIGGVLLGILSVVPVISLGNCLCCAWVIGGGVLSSYLYVKGSPVGVTLGRGVALGMLTGAIGALVDTVFSIPLQLLLSRLGMGASQEIQQMMEQIPQFPPELKRAVLSVLAGGKGISFLVVVVGALFKLAIYSVVAMIGGALGVAIFEKRDKRGPTPGAGTFYQPPPPSFPQSNPPPNPPESNQAPPPDEPQA